MKGAIVMPAGSGKTTLSKKYKNIYDIDSFHTKENIEQLTKLYKEVVISNDWGKYNNFEISLIKDKINQLPTPFILLVHCKEKADLLNLTYLGSCKTSKKIMEKIAFERGKKNKLQESQTIDNWTYIEAPIFESHLEIENYITYLCKQHSLLLYLAIQNDI